MLMVEAMSHAAVVPFVASIPIRKGIRGGEGRVREGRGRGRGREEGKRGGRRGGGRGERLRGGRP